MDNRRDLHDKREKAKRVAKYSLAGIVVVLLAILTNIAMVQNRAINNISDTTEGQQEILDYLTLLAETNQCRDNYDAEFFALVGHYLLDQDVDPEIVGQQVADLGNLKTLCPIPSN